MTFIPAFLRDPALGAVLDAIPSARVVGGAVRDALAGRAVADVDLASPLPPEAVMAALKAAGLKAVPTGIAHGTVTAVVDGRGFEITTLRRDVETDGRHAVVAFTEDWRADAARRDFTINAMSMTRDGAVSDWFGGVRDLADGRVRFVGDPADRIAEDYLRILRFFRFHARYGRVPPDDDTIAAIRAGVPGLARLSVERVWSELRRILAAPDPADAVARMAEWGVLAAVLPEGTDLSRLRRLVAAGAPADPILRLAALFAGDADALATRLRFSKADAAMLVALRGGPVPADGDDDDALLRMLADETADVLIGRAWLAGTGAAVRERLAALPRPVFPLAGRNVTALGVPHGPRVGEILRATRAWWLAEGTHPDTDACRDHARRLAREPVPAQSPPAAMPGDGRA